MEASGTIKQTQVLTGTYSVASNLTFDSNDNNEKWLPYQAEVVTLDGGSTGQILPSGVTNFTFEGFHIQNLGTSIQSGMYLAGGTGYIIRWNVWNNCLQYCLMGSGVSNSLIDSNTFTNQTPGNFNGTANAYSAINFFYGSSDNTFSHNLLQNLEGGGIAVETGPSDPDMSNNVEDRNLAINVDSNVVDMGAMYMYDARHTATGLRITNNKIFNHGGVNYQTDQTKAIYLDGLTSNVTVTGNICSHCGQFAIQWHGGDHDIVQNNIFDLSTAGIGAGLYQSSTGDTGMVGNIFTNNIVYSAGSFPSSLWTVYVSTEALPTDNANMYFSATGSPIPNSGVVDTNPVLMDPQFSNPVANDYSLQATSPAFTHIGFPILPTDQGPLPYNP